MEKRGPGRPRIQREHRVPLGAPRLKLKVEEDPSVVRRWVNDKDSRIDYAVEGGYRHVMRMDDIGVPDVNPGNTDLGSRTSKVVGTKDDGTPLRAYLMEIPREQYEEDQSEKESRIKETERSILSGNIDGQASDGRYIPSQGIRVRS